MTIYNPFHSIGLFSVFDNEIIKTVDVYAGGFDAEYGDRISAVMDIKSKDGNKKRLSGKYQTTSFVLFLYELCFCAYNIKTGLIHPSNGYTASLLAVRLLLPGRQASGI